MMDIIQKKVEDNIQSLEPDALVKMWLPLTMQGFQGLGEIQKAFWSQMQNVGTDSDKSSKKK